MPSGKTHDRVTLWSLPWLVGISFGITRSGELTLILAGGYLFSGLMFGPDLDIYSVQYKRWGILRHIWLPYQKTLRHRSKLSHGLIVGTVLRVVYLLTLVALIGALGVAIAQLVVGFAWNWQDFATNVKTGLIRYRIEAIALFIGLELGAVSHILADIIGSQYKRLQRRKSKPKKAQTRRKTQRKTGRNSRSR